MADQLADRCRELFEYRDGVLYWRAARRGGRIPAGSVAGCEDGRSGRWRILVNGRLYFRSRVVFLMHNDRWPVGEVDHINRMRTDDRVENLREVTRSQNMFNIGVRGTARHVQSGRWRSQIMLNGKSTFLGLFDTEPEAHAAYIAAKAKYHIIEEAA